jgi:hypothetical protein
VQDDIASDNVVHAQHSLAKPVLQNLYTGLPEVARIKLVALTRISIEGFVDYALMVSGDS